MGRLLVSHRYCFPILFGFVLAMSCVSVAVAATADHLLISEVVTKSRSIGGMRIGSEFIEVVNPTGADIDLSDVYLSDGTYSSSGIHYWNIASEMVNSATTGGGDFYDFHVRFPDGYVLSSQDTLSISVNGSTQYYEAYGQLPDLELYEDGQTLDAVPQEQATQVRALSISFSDWGEPL